MAKKKQNIPSYGTIEINGVTYFRTRITDADGKRVPLLPKPHKDVFWQGYGVTPQSGLHRFLFFRR